MSTSASEHQGRAERALILAATARDGEVLRQTLANAGVETEICRDVEFLCASIVEGAGCVVVAEECLSPDTLSVLRKTFAGEPSWSEIPIVAMIHRGESIERSSQIVRRLGGVARVILLERPVATMTITSAIQAAMRSRRHQYRVRDTIEKLSSTEASLKESEARLRLAVGSGPVVLFGQDRQLRYTWIVHPIDGFAEERILGWTDEEILGSERGAPLSAVKRRVLETGVGARTEYWLHLDRGWTAWDVNLEPLRNEEGAVVGLTGVSVDITERRLAERERERAEARLRAAVEGSGIGIFEYDLLEGRLEASERSWQIVTGRAQPSSDGLERWNEVVHPEDRERTMKAWARALDPEEDESYEAEFRAVREDGSTRWVSARGQLRFEESESGARPTRLVGTVQDVTDDRAAEERLRVLTAELERRVAARTEKLEHRTGQLRRLANQLVTAEQRERGRLAQMLHDHLQQILAAAKIHVDLFQGRFQEAELNEKLKEVQGLLEEAVTASRSLSIELSPPALQNGPMESALRWQAQWMETHHRLHTDLFVERDLPRIATEVKILLYEAVRELLFNIVKHAEVRSCSLRLFSEGGRLCLLVEDEGKGFDPESLEQAGGEGFGLFSIRERVQAIGGQIEIESAPSKGTTFRIHVPAIRIPSVVEGHQNPAAGAESRAVDRQQKIRVLVVDDHPIVRDGIVSLLRRSADMEVVGEAADGEEAIDLAELLKPDIIVMDVNMPGIGGLEATREIKKRQPQISIVGLSVQREEAAADEMVRAGASAFLTKGGRSELLFETLRKVAELH